MNDDLKNEKDEKSSREDNSKNGKVYQIDPETAGYRLRRVWQLQTTDWAN